MKSMIAPRTIKDGPFCWQNKAMRRLIRERFAELNCISSALSIYDALCELASDEEAELFKAATPTIASTAGVGTRTAQSILPKLEAIGVIDIAEQTFPGTNMDAPSIYTLLKLEAEPNAVRNSCAAVSNGCAPLRNGRKQTSLRTSEETEKKTEKKDTEEIRSSPEAKAAKFSSDIVESIYKEFPRKEGKQPALKAIGKALVALEKRGQEDPVDWLLGRVRSYAEHCQREGKEPRHIKMPQGWFGDARYDDDLASPVSAALGCGKNVERAAIPNYFARKPDATSLVL